MPKPPPRGLVRRQHFGKRRDVSAPDCCNTEALKNHGPDFEKTPLGLPKSSERSKKQC